MQEEEMENIQDPTEEKAAGAVGQEEKPEKTDSDELKNQQDGWDPSSEEQDMVSETEDALVMQLLETADRQTVKNSDGRESSVRNTDASRQTVGMTEQKESTKPSDSQEALSASSETQNTGKGDGASYGRYSTDARDAVMAACSPKEASARGKAFDKARIKSDRCMVKEANISSRLQKASEKSSGLRERSIRKGRSYTKVSRKLEKALRNPFSSAAKIRKLQAKAHRKYRKWAKEERKYMKAAYKTAKLQRKDAKLQCKLEKYDVRMEQALYSPAYMQDHKAAAKASQVKDTIKEKMTGTSASYQADAIPSSASNMRQTAADKVTEAKDSVSEKISDIKESVSEKVTGVKDTVTGTRNAAMDQVSDAGSAAVYKANSLINSGIDRTVAVVGPVVRSVGERMAAFGLDRENTGSENTGSGKKSIGKTLRDMASSMKNTAADFFSQGDAVSGTWAAVSDAPYPSVSNQMYENGQTAVKDRTVQDMAYGHSYEKEDLRTVGETVTAGLEEQAANASTPEEKKEAAASYITALSGMQAFGEGVKEQASQIPVYEVQDDAAKGAANIARSFTDPIMQSAAEDKYQTFDSEDKKQLENLNIPGTPAYSEYQMGVAELLPADAVAERQMGGAYAVPEMDPQSVEDTKEAEDAFVPIDLDGRDDSMFANAGIDDELPSETKTAEVPVFSEGVSHEEKAVTSEKSSEKAAEEKPKRSRGEEAAARLGIGNLLDPQKSDEIQFA